MDIKEILDDLKIPYLESGHHHTRPGWIQLEHCPFCGSNAYHLGVNLARGNFVCWRCKGHSQFETFVALGVGRKRAYDLSRTIESGAQIEPERTRISLVEPDGRGPLLPPHRRYLESRGFDPDEIARLWEVEGFGIVSGGLQWRLYIPIIEGGRRVSWTTRTISHRDDVQRYLSASFEQEAVNHKHVLYGAHYCRQSVVVLEGPTDVWNVGPGAVGTFGTAFSDEQVTKISKFPYRYVCFDSSPTAQALARALCAQLSCFAGVTENLQIDAEDPGSASRKEVALLRRHCNL